MPDGDSSENGRVGVDDDTVLEDGVARYALDGVSVLVEWKTLRSEGHSLIELHVIAYDAGGPDDDTCAMVDGEVVPDLGSRVDVDARF